MELNILFHGNNTEFKSAIPKITSLPSINTTALMLGVAHACPLQTFQSLYSNVTETSYIQVTVNPHLRMELTSSNEGHTSHPSFLQLLHHTFRFLHDTSGTPKILCWIHLTPLVMLALWGAPHK